MISHPFVTIARGPDGKYVAVWYDRATKTWPTQRFLDLGITTADGRTHWAEAKDAELRATPRGTQLAGRMS